MITFNAQTITPEERAELLAFIDEKMVEGLAQDCTPYMVGSRARCDERPDSDLDIVCISNNHSVRGGFVVNYKGTRTMIARFDRTPEQAQWWSGYHLSIYNLRTGELLAGNDDAAFKARFGK